MTPQQIKQDMREASKRGLSVYYKAMGATYGVRVLDARRLGGLLQVKVSTFNGNINGANQPIRWVAVMPGDAIYVQ